MLALVNFCLAVNQVSCLKESLLSVTINTEHFEFINAKYNHSTLHEYVSYIYLLVTYQIFIRSGTVLFQLTHIFFLQLLTAEKILNRDEVKFDIFISAKLLCENIH